VRGALDEADGLRGDTHDVAVGEVVAGGRRRVEHLEPRRLLAFEAIGLREGGREERARLGCEVRRGARQKTKTKTRGSSGVVRTS
jgi:hypothetical protein